MADKAIGELIAAEKVNPSDLFVLEQDGAAKKLPGRILENWLLAMAQGHGGIHSIDKVGTSGLVDTYRITLADTSYFDFPVTNGRSIAGISKTSSSGLVDTYTIRYNDGSTSTFTVTNGAKGDKGDNAYTWVKYASQEPTEASHSMGDIPDDWRGEYNGPLAEAPTDWKQYKWYKIKGEKGDTGDAAILVSRSVTYQVSDSGTIIPSGAWGSSIPVVPQGKYLWTRTELKFNSGDPVTSYTVARMGIDGTGSVSAVNNVSPDSTGNVTLTAADVGALPVSGGAMEGTINMNGQPISGLNDPTEDTQAARKGYVDASVRKAAPRNLLDNSDFRNPVMQAGLGGMHGAALYAIDRWMYNGSADHLSLNDGNGLSFAQYYVIYQLLAFPVTEKAHTLAIWLSDGTIGCVTLSWQYASVGNTGFSAAHNGENRVYINKVGVAKSPIKYVALYEGTYTAETLPEYQPKGYGAELAECQRYYREYDAITLAPWVYEGTSQRHYRLNFDTPMRVAPTVDVSQLLEKQLWSNLSSSFNTYRTDMHGIVFAAISDIVSQSNCYVEGKLSISADM